MTARLLTPRCTVLLLLLTVFGGGWCQTQLLDPEPRTCRAQANAADAFAPSQGRRNEYPAGGVVMVLAQVPAGLFGSLEIYLCPEGDVEDECLDRVPLQLADGSGTSYSLQKVPRNAKYEIPVILPDDITCPACTLQLRVLSRNCAREAACPLTEDTFCSDITVRDIKVPSRRWWLTGKNIKNIGKCITCLGKVITTVEECVACGGNVDVSLEDLDIGDTIDNVTKKCKSIFKLSSRFCRKATPNGGNQHSSKMSKKNKKKRRNH